MSTLIYCRQQITYDWKMQSKPITQRIADQTSEERIDRGQVQLAGIQYENMGIEQNLIYGIP